MGTLSVNTFTPCVLFFICLLQYELAQFFQVDGVDGPCVGELLDCSARLYEEPIHIDAKHCGV